MKKTVLKLPLFFISFLFLLFPIQNAMAFEMFGVENKGSTSNIFGGRPENIKNWPKGIVETIEGMQAQMLLQSGARGIKNWLIDRQVTGEAVYNTNASKIERSFLGGLWDGLTNTVGSFLGLDKDRLSFTGEDILYGPQDCKYPVDRPGRVEIYKSNLDIQGTMKDGEKSVYYQFVANISMSLWDCEGVVTPESPDSPAVAIDWNKVLAKSVNTVGPMVDESFKQGLAVKYGITYKSGEEARREMDEILKRQQETQTKTAQQQTTVIPEKKTEEQTCFLTDPLNDHYDLITKNKGKIGSTDLKSAQITKRGEDLEITIRTNGAIPQLDTDSSQAYEIGFDVGRGSGNSLTPRNGADLLFVVDVGQNAVTGFKKTPWKQDDWSPKNFRKIENGISFTIPFNAAPLRIYSSSAIGNALEFDMMQNEGMRKCF